MNLFRKITHTETPVSARILFHENEVETNRLSAYTMLALAVAVFMLGLVSKLREESFDLGEDWCVNLVVVDAFLFLLTFLIAKAVRFDRPWLKDMILFNSLLFSAVIYFMYPLNSAFMMFGPILLSTRYYNEKLTGRVALETWICYVTVMQLGLFLNQHVEAVARLRAYLEITLFNYPDVVWKYHIVPRTFVLLITGVLAVLQAKNGRLMIIRQAETAKTAAALGVQMDLAADIQTKALPAPAFATSDGAYQLSCSMNPAKEVGGDFYDYFMLGEDRLAILIADVSDKGLPAAMFMMAAQNALRLSLETCDTVDEAFRKANAQLCKTNQDGMFVTVWGGVIDLAGGRTEFVNAGHMPPLISAAADGQVSWLENDPDIFLGVCDDAELRANTFTLAEGDCLVLYTDGVTDAKNSKGERFGNERLLEAVKKYEKSAPVLREGIEKEVKAFYRGMPQFDDITLLICERKVTVAKSDGAVRQ